MQSATEFDVHAEVFVPQVFTDINKSRAQVIETNDAAGTSFSTYAATFAGFQYLAPLQLLPFPAMPGDHLKFWWQALVDESQAEIQYSSRYNMYAVQLTIYQDSSPSMFVLKVPGLREGAPRVRFGDTIKIRILVLDVRGQPRYMEQWTHVKGLEVGGMTPGFTGFEYHARVHAVSNPKAEVYLRIDHFPSFAWHNNLCNIMFPVSRRFVDTQHRALIAIDQDLRRIAETAVPEANGLVPHFKPRRTRPTQPAKSSLAGLFSGTQLENVPLRFCTNWTRRMLFPENTDGVKTYIRPTLKASSRYVDKDVNYEQKVSTQWYF